MQRKKRPMPPNSNSRTCRKTLAKRVFLPRFESSAARECVIPSPRLVRGLVLLVSLGACRILGFARLTAAYEISRDDKNLASSPPTLPQRTRKSGPPSFICGLTSKFILLAVVFESV